MVAKSETMQRVCDALLVGDRLGADAIARHEYPFVPADRLPRWERTVSSTLPTAVALPLTKTRRAYSKRDLTALFARDGFIDRYSGERLVYPPIFRLLAQLLPEAFPAHPNWKLAESHLAYWELFATLDHIVPVVAGGPDAAPNWATTAMTRNMWKSNASLAEVGWSLVPPGDFAAWNGLSGWFLDYVSRHPECRADKYIADWHRAAVQILGSRR